MQNVRALLVYLAIVATTLAIVVAVALYGWAYAVTLALYPANNLARLYEAIVAHGVVAWIRAADTPHTWVPWRWWWSAGPRARLHYLTDPTPHAGRVRWVLAAEGVLAASTLTLSPLRRLWGPLWFVMGRVGHLRPGTTHGSARWGSTRGLWPRPWWTPVVLGRRGGRWVGLPWSQAILGVLVVGLPGAGKSTALIIANILRLGGNPLARVLIRLGVVMLPSVVVTDPKGEIHDLTAGWLTRRGYDVVRIDLLGRDTDRYNPLAHCRPDHVEDIQRLARVWVANSGTDRAGFSGDTPFWDLTLQELLVAAIAHKNAVARARGRQAATLAEVFTFLRQDPAAIAEELEDSVAAARMSYERFMTHLKKDPRLEGSVFVGAGLRGQVFDIAAARAHTRTDTLGDFRVLGRTRRRPVALFVAPTPGQEDTLRPLLACLFTQLLDALTDEANHNGSARKELTRPVLGWLDEAGTIGAVAGLADGLNRLRGAGVALVISVQQLVQLELIYGEEWRAIAGGTQTHVLFAGVGHDDARRLSKALGETTVVQEQRTASRRREHFWTDQGSIARSEARRSLLDPDELRRMGRNHAIVEIANRRPFPITTVPWFRVRSLSRVRKPLTARAGAPLVQRPDAPAVPVGPTPRAYNGRVPHVRARPAHAVEWDSEVTA